MEWFDKIFGPTIVQGQKPVRELSEAPAAGIVSSGDPLLDEFTRGKILDNKDERAIAAQQSAVEDSRIASQGIDDKTNEIVYYDANGNEIKRAPVTRDQQSGISKAKKAAKKASGKKALSKATNTNIEFDDQSFLWDFIRNFQNVDLGESSKLKAKRLLKDPIEKINLDKFEGAGGSKYRYRNFIQISDDQPLITLNKLLGYGVHAFNEVSNPQLSSIVPYFRLYKVITNDNTGVRTKIEFPFNKFTTVDSILNSNTGRGTDVGFKSVDWVDTSSNPGNMGLNFKGTLKLHFQSFEGIFKERTVDGEKITFADLLHQSSALGKNASKNEKSSKEEDAQAAGVNCGKAPEIHMEVGWSLPPEVEGNKNFSDELLRARRTYVLSVQDQQIDFTENGTVDLSVTFCAAIEGRSMSQNSDLLSIDESSELAFSLDPFEENVTFSEVKKEYQEERKRINKSISESQKNKSLTKQQRSNSIKKLKKEREELKESFGEIKTQVRQKRYARFLDLIRSGTENRLFYYDVDASTYEWYKKFLKFQAESTNGIRSEKDKEEKKQLLKEYREDRQERLSDFDDSNIDPSQIGFANPNSLTSKVKENKKSKNKKTKNSPKLVDGKYRINYVFLGDLIETAMQIIYDNPNIINGKRAKNNPKCPTLRQEIRVCLGTFPYVDPATGKVVSVQIADVPISLNYFNSWWYDNVISKNKDTYPLRLFLQDFCSKLLNNVMSPKKYGGIISKGLSFKIQSIFTKKGHPLNERWESNSKGKKDRLSINEAFKNRGDPGTRDIAQWIYLYVRGGDTENSMLNGDPIEDKRRNLPHFYVGADKGIVKNISFSRTKIKNKLESNLLRSKEGGDQNSNLLFADRYDADITIFGNPTFKPSMFLYVNPRSLGLGITTDDARSYMSDLAVGGYYRVTKVSNTLTEDSYETKIDTILELSTRQIAKARKGLQ